MIKKISSVPNSQAVVVKPKKNSSKDRSSKGDGATFLWYKLQKVKKIYSHLIARNRGAPMQLLAGNPLSMMGNEFLKSVIRDLDVEGLMNEKGKKRKLRVVSVIGAQSSAKSTLLNFLFGTEFAV